MYCIAAIAVVLVVRVVRGEKGGEEGEAGRWLGEDCLAVRLDAEVGKNTVKARFMLSLCPPQIHFSPGRFSPAPSSRIPVSARVSPASRPCGASSQTLTLVWSEPDTSVLDSEVKLYRNFSLSFQSARPGQQYTLHSVQAHYEVHQAADMNIQRQKLIL